MELEKVINGDKATVKFAGRIDAKTAPEHEKALLALPVEIMELDIDFSDVEYISSAGLRVLMMIQKEYNAKGGSLKIVDAKEEIIEIFEVTGFTDFLNIEY